MTTQRAPGRILPIAFPGISPDEVQELIFCSQVRNHPAGTTLCRENATEDTFYVLLDGRVEVTKSMSGEETRLLKILDAGDFFGEMALIHNAPRSATVKSITPVVVMEIKREAFDRVLRRSSSVSMAMVREISDRLRRNDQMAIEDLRMRAGELAEAYQKLAEQDFTRREFLSRVAHELRTPLMAASGFLQMLRKNAIPGEQVPDVMEKVERNVQQIVHLVNDILFLQEMDLVLPEFQEVRMEQIAHTVVADHQKRAEKHGIRIKVRESVDLPTVPGDARSLERALAALMDNAIKFSPQGGDVEVTVGTKEGMAYAAVKDRGIGISADALPHIFDRYYHLDKSGDQLFGGLGLGLAIAQQVIKQHGGKLEAVSKQGKGSTFTMYLNITPRQN